MEKGQIVTDDTAEIYSEKIPYRQAVGSLMYMALAMQILSLPFQFVLSL